VFMVAAPKISCRTKTPGGAVTSNSPGGFLKSWAKEAPTAIERRRRFSEMYRSFRLPSQKKLYAMMEDFSTIESADSSHREMDNLMVGLLRKLGYDAAMDIYEEAEKWYT